MTSYGARQRHAYLERGEVDHIVDVWVVVEDLVESSLVCNVGLVEFGPLAADEFDAVDDFLGRVVEAVDDDDLVVGLEQGEGREGANVARTAGQMLV